MTYDPTVPEHLAPLIAAELQDGERIVWIGQPLPRRFARRSIPAVLFGIPWTAFTLFMFAPAPKTWDMLGSFLALGVPFLLIGLAMISSPYWVIRKGRRTAYAVTDRRAIIFDGGWWSSTTILSFEPSRLHDIRRIQHADGSGDLIFERTWKKDSDGDVQSTDHGFLAIADVKEVELLVQQLREAAN
jgi:hypothetical protein